jgi:hypothetical protein
MRKPVTTLPNGEARLKDYDVFKCIADKDKMEVMYYDEKMTLTYEELTSKRVSTSDKTYKSQFAGGKDYKLLGYDWNPDTVEL